jgi:hypothetical protein
MSGLMLIRRSWMGKHSTTPARADRVSQAAWAVTGIHTSGCRPRVG